MGISWEVSVCRSDLEPDGEEAGLFSSGMEALDSGTTELAMTDKWISKKYNKKIILRFFWQSEDVEDNIAQ